MSPQNECTPTNIFGPFKQTLFLGASVMSVSASVGFNEQVGELTVQLVEDPCASPDGTFKRYYDQDLNPQEWTDADPGFFGTEFNLIGTPVYFRIANFEFCGLLQSWTENNSISGKPVYTVKIVDPRQILEGTQLIIGNYSGSVYNTYNLLNVFGYQEALAANCPENEAYNKVPPFFYGGFGGAEANENGMPWNLIKQSISLLTCSVPAIINDFSPYGRLVFRGVPLDGGDYGMGIIAADTGSQAHYFVDVAELPFAPTYYKIGGSNVSIMDAITSICEDSGCDYYIELVPVKDSNDNIYKFIKIRTASRALQPDLTFISEFLDDTDNVISSSVGRELRNETTSKFIIGGNIEGVFEMAQDDIGTSGTMEDDIIAPYWGMYSGEAIPTLVDDSSDTPEMYFIADVSNLNLQLNSSLGGDAAEIREFELQMALGGFDSWLTWSSMINEFFPSRNTIWKLFKDANTTADMKGVWDLGHLLGIINTLAANELAPRDLTNIAQNAFRDRADDVEKDLQTIYQFVETLARENYGRKYMVRIPFVCFQQDNESGQIITSESPSDSGWTEASSVLGLPDVLLEQFKNDQNKVTPFIKFNTVDTNKLDITNLSIDDFQIYDNDLYVRANIQEELVFYDGTPRVVLDISQAILKKADDDVLNEAMNRGIAGIIRAARLINDATALKVQEITKGVAADSLTMPMEYQSCHPNEAAVTLKSNIISYGPYYVAGPPGRVTVELDEGLVPWEYNGVTTMNLAGLEKATESLTQMQISEMGTITIPGYPDKALGAELMSTGNTHLFENRVIANEAEPYSVTMGNWTGLYGPNITNVNVEVGLDGVQTSYQMRTFTPQFGRFSRSNSERLKSLAKLKTSLRRTFNVSQNKDARIGLNKVSDADKRGVNETKGVNSRPEHSPHEVFVGHYKNWNSGEYRRAIVASESLMEVGKEMTNDWSSKAVMSLDGLIRPVSITGGGGLPRFAVDDTDDGQYVSRNAMPPLQHPLGGDLYKLRINNDYLNPFSTSSTPKHGTSESNDIEILGRGETSPTGHIVRVIGEDDNYDDFRPFALRGPLLMHGWGYDLNGKPVPNLADVEADCENGIFVNENLTDSFMENWLRKPHTWPVGQVDLRFDKTRGVWVCPPPYKLVIATITESISPNGSGSATVSSMNGSAYDSDGIEVSSPTITITDVVGNTYASGDDVIAYYDTQLETYLVLDKKASSGSSSIIRFRLTDDKALTDVSVSGVSLDYEGTPVSGVTLIDTIGEWGPALIGYEGWAVAMDDRPEPEGDPEYEILFLEGLARWIQIRLKTDMSAGSATAELYQPGIVKGWGSAPNGVQPEDEENVTVYDPQNLFQRALTNAKGYAVFDEQRNQYILMQCETKAKWITFSISGPITTSISVTPTDFWQGQNPGTSTVIDPCGNIIDCTSGTAIACYDDIEDVYVVTEVNNVITISGNDAFGSPISSDRVKEIVLGSGLIMEQVDCDIVIHATGGGTGLCIGNGDYVVDCESMDISSKCGVYELKFGPGLVAHNRSSEPGDAVRSFIRTAISVQNDPLDIYNPFRIVNLERASAFQFGRGLAVQSYDGDSCQEEAQIVMDLSVGSVDHVSKLTLGCGMMATPDGDAVAKLSAGIKVDVEGVDIATGASFMSFSECFDIEAQEEFGCSGVSISPKATHELSVITGIGISGDTLILKYGTVTVMACSTGVEHSEQELELNISSMIPVSGIDVVVSGGCNESTDEVDFTTQRVYVICENAMNTGGC